MTYRAAPGDPPAKVVNGRVVYTESRTQHFYSPSSVPVVAYADGIVVQAATKPRINGDVWIHHPELGKVTRYAHLRDLQVTKGQAVAAGQVVGTMHSGSGTPFRHLHFEVLTAGKKGSQEDPAPWLAQAEVRGPGPSSSPARPRPATSDATKRGATGSPTWATLLLLLPFALRSTRG